MADLRKLLKIAEKAALQASKHVLEIGDKGRKVKLDKFKDVKICADKQSENIIVKYLKSVSELPILSEESGEIGNISKDSLFWVVDPLDGSLNFLRRIPICCISVAVWKENKPLLGVVYDFYRKELFSGIVGYGAWLNKESISVSKVKEKNKAIMFTGIPTKAKLSLQYSKELFSLIKQYKKCRWIGSAALSLAYVAAGRGDVYCEKNIMLWDIAAGLTIAVAAGSDYYLKVYKDRAVDIFVSNKHLLNCNMR
jgi:myo-inositol-1(or 4)-monophosphatase